MASRPDFSSLLEQSQQLAAQTSAAGMPAIQRGIEQIDEISRRLALSAAATGDSARNKANYLLAGKGFDAERLARVLGSVNIKTTFEPLEALSETDIEGYLRHEHNMLILTAVEEANRDTVQQAQQNYMASFRAEWDSAKRRLLETLGQRTGAWTPELTLQPSQLQGQAQGMLTMGGRVGVAPPAPTASAMLGAAAAEYGRVVLDLNKRRLEKKPYALAWCFRLAAEKIDERDTVRRENVAGCWGTIGDMMGEADVNPLNGDFLKEAVAEMQYAVAYRDSSRALYTRLIGGARRFLEKQYMKLVIEEKIKAQRVQARVGGAPGVLNKVRGYLNAVYQRSSRDWPSDLEDFVEGFPVWPQVFHCLRAGDGAAALQVLETLQTPYATSLISALRDLLNQRRPGEALLRELQSEYQKLTIQSKNMHKQAVYNLIGRFDDKALLRSLYPYNEDYMWFRLSMIDDTDERRQMEGLQRLQSNIREWGPKSFATKTPLRYVHVLFLTCQFERAIDYLQQHDAYYVEAAHFAIALHYYGCLRVPSTDAAPMLSSESGVAQAPVALNFGQLLRKYVHVVADNDVVLAANYVFVAPAPLRVAYFLDLIRRTHKYADLLGKVLPPDNSRQEGYLKRFLSDLELRNVTETVAADCESAGQFDDAVAIYHLAQDYVSMVRMANGVLGPVISTAGPRRDAALRLANDVQDRLQRDVAPAAGLSASPYFVTFRTLLTLAKFFHLYHANKLKEALEVLREANVVALEERAVERLKSAFNQLDDTVRDAMPDLLLAAITLLYRLYQDATSRAPSTAPDPARDQYVRALKSNSAALRMFAGIIPFRIPPEVNATITRLDAVMTSPDWRQ